MARKAVRHRLTEEGERERGVCRKASMSARRGRRVHVCPKAELGAAAADALSACGGEEALRSQSSSELGRGVVDRSMARRGRGDEQLEGRRCCRCSMWIAQKRRRLASSANGGNGREAGLVSARLRDEVTRKASRLFDAGSVSSPRKDAARMVMACRAAGDEVSMP